MSGSSPTSLLTVGHGTAGQAELVGLLAGAGVTCLIDVRRHPGSRAHPHVRREALAEWLPAAGIEYRWDERLGGRRRLPEQSPDCWWQVASFRAYAAHMRTAGFFDAVGELLAEATTSRTTVMCSETVWWRCHRRLIADFVTLARGTPVRHLAHDGRLAEHRPSPGARLTAEAVLVYDLPERPPSRDV